MPEIFPIFLIVVFGLIISLFAEQFLAKPTRCCDRFPVDPPGIALVGRKRHAERHLERRPGARTCRIFQILQILIVFQRRLDENFSNRLHIVHLAERAVDDLSAQMRRCRRRMPSGQRECMQQPGQQHAISNVEKPRPPARPPAFDPGPACSCALRRRAASACRIVARRVERNVPAELTRILTFAKLLVHRVEAPVVAVIILYVLNVGADPSQDIAASHQFVDRDEAFALLGKLCQR